MALADARARGSRCTRNYNRCAFPIHHHHGMKLAAGGERVKLAADAGAGDARVSAQAQGFLAV